MTLASSQTLAVRIALEENCKEILPHQSFIKCFRMIVVQLRSKRIKNAIEVAEDSAYKDHG